VARDALEPGGVEAEFDRIPLRLQHGHGRHLPRRRPVQRPFGDPSLTASREPEVDERERG